MKLQYNIIYYYSFPLSSLHLIIINPLTIYFIYPRPTIPCTLFDKLTCLMKNNTIIKSYCNLLLIVHLEDLIHEPFHLGWDLPTLRLPVPTHYHQFYALLTATHHTWLFGVLHFLELELIMLKGHVPWLVHRQFLFFFFLLGLGQIFLLLQLQRLRSNLIEHIVRLKAFRFLVLRNRGDFDLNLLLFNLLHFLLELKANTDIRWKSGRSW